MNTDSFRAGQRVWITWPYIFGDAKMTSPTMVHHEVLVIEDMTDAVGKLDPKYREGTVVADDYAKADGWVAVHVADDFDSWWFRPDQLRKARDGA